MKPELFVGIDGGASKTAAILCDAAGKILAQSRGGASVIGPTVSPELAATLRAVQADLLRQSGVAAAAIRGWALGLNGVDFADEHAAQLAAVARTLDLPSSAHLTLVNDGIVALWGASAAPAAAILQHGSGVTAAWRSDYGREHLFDHLNVGQLFEMRTELLALIARMLDGREPRSALLPRVLEHLQTTPDDYPVRLYRHQLDDVQLRTTPPLIYEAWQAGDPAATRLVHAAVADYARLAITLAHRTQSAKPELVFGGGVINVAPPAFLDALRAAVLHEVPGATIRRPLLPPEFGAALLAAHRAGHAPGAILEAWRAHYVAEKPS